MPTATHVGLSIGSLLGGVLLFAVVAPDHTRHAVKSIEEAAQLKLHTSLLPDEYEKCEALKAQGKGFGCCKKCAKSYPGRTDQCMSCGEICKKKTCEGLEGMECAKSEPFQSCHKVCMAKDWTKAKDETKDCYFDPECHKLVDWDMVTKVKMGFFARAKSVSSADELKPMWAGLHARLVKAGVPEDRAWPMVKKWAAAVEKKDAPAPAEKAAADAKGCYDKGAGGYWCPKGDGTWYEKKSGKVYDEKSHKVYDPKAEAAGKAAADAKGCYDKGADGYWCPKGDGTWYEKKSGKVYDEKSHKVYDPKAEAAEKSRSLTCAACIKAGQDYCINANRCTERATRTCEGPFDHVTGSPDFAKAAPGHSMECPSEGVEEGAGRDKREKLPSEDCYFDPECHKLVDWELVTEAKTSFFARSKQLASRGDVRALAAELRAELVKAGVPEDRVGYIVTKWVKAAVKDFKDKEAASPASGGEIDSECAKYEGKGALAVRGCHRCSEYYPGRTEQCMGCGGVCVRKTCDDDNIGECVKTEPFKECHFACMAKSDIDQETQSDVKFKRFISSMFDRVGNFLGSS